MGGWIPILGFELRMETLHSTVTILSIFCSYFVCTDDGVYEEVYLSN